MAYWYTSALNLGSSNEPLAAPMTKNVIGNNYCVHYKEDWEYVLMSAGGGFI